MAQSDEPLRIDLLGGLQIHRGARKLVPPASRKARALLGFLIVTGQAHRRERLCDIFWDMPDDPRASLRSALSQLRPLIDHGQVKRLRADRERVGFARAGAAIDYLDLASAFDGPGPFAPEGVAGALELLGQTLLAGLDLPGLPEYQAWLNAARSDAEALRERLKAYSEPPAPRDRETPATLGASRQRIGYGVAPDGVCIAYASIGDGPALIKAANWLNHLELDWESPVWAPLLRDLARDRRLIRYDARGNGLSDWDVEDLSFEAFVADLECVVDASGCTRFPLLGLSQGVAVAIEYAARHPEKVSHLVLWGGYAAGWRVEGDADLRAEREALMTLFRQGWERDDARYRQVFSRAFMPLATEAELDAFDDLQRATTTPENAARSLEMFADIDVRHRLGRIAAPTLVMHGRGDKRVPFIQGARIAAGMPNAEFITLSTDNHLLIGREPAYGEFLAHVREFLAK
ncbi:MAG: alpha/beta fold hydrolase [Caulobacteraceae bacterium]|nr:alpha/beta fold hydrolase [Caulobacteraceae bacterium]